MAVFKFRNLKNGQATPIPPGEFTIGRADDTYIHLEDPSVSRHHAKISNTVDGFFLEDLGSANGTAFRGERLTGRTRVELGDVAYIGAVPFRIDPERAGEPSATPSAGLRNVNRAYIRRDTERISLGAMTLSQELTAPQLYSVSPAKPAGTPPAEPAPSRPLETAAPAPVAVPSSPSETAPAPSLSPTLSEPPVAPVRAMTARWLLVVFLAGLGTGLLLGLYFAKVFLDLGGKASMLP